ncbi:carbohydrate ABC transporter permease [Paenibacillus sp. URB8-2]|uniref:carbohydrate ABC transporter permease n=1 Tax=Paenibacillus sp. URB8-2 TaxID=2741301 RepID=UPI0015B85455|nr:carbohydrate ABC transporter permease [Paenibacillus sp. URB8-2]BCG60179.1 sugar ABC transporter permease [Paenibacillus sp. URB8-2]
MKINALLEKLLSRTILSLFLVYTLFPMLWLVMASLKTNVELLGDPFRLPAPPQFGNYVNAFKSAHLALLFSNSVVISFSATALNALVASMAAYVLSRYKFKFGSVIFSTLITGILVPVSALMVPYFTLIRTLGLYDTKLALILTYTAISLPLSVFIIKGFMDSIPGELEEAALLDGCDFYQKFFRVIVPISRTGIVTAATFQFLSSWNEFLYAMLLTSSEQVRTLQMGIRFFASQFTTDFTSMFAAIVISIIPSVAMYSLFQNQIISGLTQGSIKG